MVVMKFGGSSLATAEKMKIVSGLILRANSETPVFAVLSAVKGTTDYLVKLSELFIHKQITEGIAVLSDLETMYNKYTDELYSSAEYKEKGKRCLKNCLDFIRSLSLKPFGKNEQLIVISQGEILSTNLFHLYISENKVQSALLSALDFMRKGESGEPDHYFMKELLRKEMEKFAEISLFVTQGFICRDYLGNVTNFSRNSSDYTATLIGKAINAARVEIWSDIDGFHNNDPRIVKNITKSIREMSYDEAIELGYFGAKIVFPHCVVPAQELNIPILLKNTFEPDKEGTLITENTIESQGVKAIAVKDGIIVIHVKSNRSLQLHNFLKKVLEVFDKHETPVDMCMSAEVSISLALTEGNNSHIGNIISELEKCGTVEVERNMAIVCIVGNGITGGDYILRICEALRGIPVRQVSSGASKFSVNLLVEGVNKEKTVIQLHHALLMNE